MVTRQRYAAGGDVAEKNVTNTINGAFLSSVARRL
jgi:hypothetical protein